MAIAAQPAMTPAPVSARPAMELPVAAPVAAPLARPRRPHGLVPVDLPPLRFTAARIIGLLAATAICVAAATAIVAGTALFALLNFAG